MCGVDTFLLPPVFGMCNEESILVAVVLVNTM